MADENTEHMRELAEAARIAAEETRRYGTASRDTMDRMAALIRSTQALNKGTGDLARSFGHAGTSIDAAADQFERAGRKFAGALEDGVDAVIAMGSSLYRGEKGAATFNRSIELASRSVQGMVGGVTKLVPLLSGLGAGLQLGTKALTVFVTAATQQADALYNSFSALTKSGGSAADGMTGVFETAKSLGLSMNELSALTDAVGQRAGDFALFGGTVADARKRLGQMGDALRNNREQFLSLGMTMPDVTEGLANYIALQGRLGRGQTQTTEQLAASARKYLLEQDALTRALGISRQEQEAANQRALVQEQFLARVNLLRASGQDEAADRLMELSRMAAGVNAEFHEAVLALASGNIANENAAKLLQSSSGVAAGAIEQLIQPGGNAALALQQIADGTRQFQATVGNMAGLVGANNQNFLALDTQQKLTNISLMGFANALEHARKEQEAMGGVNQKAQDEMTANQARLMEIQTRANETLERFVGEGIVKTQAALITFTDAIANSTEKIREFFFDEFTIKHDGERLVAENLAVNSTKLEELGTKLGEATAAYERTQTLTGPGAKAAQQSAREKVDALRAQETELHVERQTQMNRAQTQRPGFGRASGAPSVVAPPNQTATGAALAAPAESPAATSRPVRTEEDLKRMGFPIKEGATQAPGRGIQPNTEEIARKVMEGIPGFTRFTGFNDGYPRGEAGASLHPVGAAFDFTLDRDPSRAQGQHLINRILGLGASKVIDEYNNPSSRATGKHIHVEVPLMARGGITSGVSIAGEAGPEAVVPLPDGRAIPVDMSGLGMDKMHSSSAMLQQAADSLNALGVNAGRELDQSFKDAMAHLREILLEAPQTADITKSLTDLDAGMAEWNRVSGVTGGNFAFAQEKLLPDMLASAQGSAVDTDFYKNIEALIKTPSGTQLGTIDDVRQMLSEQSTNNADSLRETQSEFRSALGQIVQEIRQNQQSNLQQEILQTLQSINRNQGRTADASQRMADVAMN